MNKYCARKLQEDFLSDRIEKLKFRLDYLAPWMLTDQALDAWTDRIAELEQQLILAVVNDQMPEDELYRPRRTYHNKQANQRADCAAGGERIDSLVEC